MTKKEKQDAFNKWWRATPSTLELKEKRIKICNECKVEIYTIRNWLYGKAEIPYLTTLKLNSIFNEKIF